MKGLTPRAGLGQYRDHEPNTHSCSQAHRAPRCPKMADARLQACVRIQAEFRSLRNRRQHTCVVCFEFTQAPVEWSSCGHRFCTSCTERWRALSNTCPLCRATQHRETSPGPSFRWQHQSPVELLESFERQQLTVEDELAQVHAYTQAMVAEATQDARPPPRTRFGRWRRRLQDRLALFGIELEAVFMIDNIIARSRN